MGRRGGEKKKRLACIIRQQSDVVPSPPVSPRSFTQRSCYNNRVTGLTFRLFPFYLDHFCEYERDILQGRKAASPFGRSLFIGRISKETGTIIHILKHTFAGDTEESPICKLLLSSLRDPGGFSSMQMNPAIKQRSRDAIQTAGGGRKRIKGRVLV